MHKVEPLISDSWLFYKSHAIALCALLMPFIIPLGIISSCVEFMPNEEWWSEYLLWFSIALSSALYPIYQGATILYISSALKGDYLKNSDYYTLSLRFWNTLFILYIMVSLAILAGFLLLVIPGLIVLSRVSFSEFYCLFNNMKATESFQNSWEQTKDIQWLLLKGILIVTFAIYVPFCAFEYVLNSIESWNLMFSFLSFVGSSFLLPLFTIFLFRVYSLHNEELNQTLNRTP